LQEILFFAILNIWVCLVLIIYSLNNLQWTII
jgi:hypothetical protein